MLMRNLNKPAIWLGFAVILLVVAYRVIRPVWLPELPNFSPLAALALCAGWMGIGLPALAVTLGAMFLSDLALNALYGTNLLTTWMLFAYPCYALSFGLGWLLRQRSWPWLAGGVLLNAILFYLITNSGSWLMNPAYAKTLAGWIQALTTGIPGFPPTWVFFRNSVFGDLLFAVLFYGAYLLASLRTPQITSTSPR